MDARFGLKPVDKELIAYLERHGVKWQAVLTKCDKVKGRDLARRMTLMKSEMSSYSRMVGEPVPISALKRRGMELLRGTMENLKVEKEVVKAGIRNRVYNLLEQRRIQRSERARRKRQAKREKEAEEKLKERAETQTPSEEAFESGGVGEGFGEFSLHSLLDDARPRGSDDSEAEGVDNKATTRDKSSVREAHYTLEDRDSARIQQMAAKLFPDLPEVPANESEREESTITARSVPELSSTLDVLASPAAIDSDESDSESDGLDVSSPVVVRRFDVPLSRQKHFEATPTDHDSHSVFPHIKMQNDWSATMRLANVRQPASTQVKVRDDWGAWSGTPAKQDA